MRRPAFAALATALGATLVRPGFAELEDKDPPESVDRRTGTSSALTLSATPVMSFAELCPNGEPGSSLGLDYCAARGFVGGELGGRIQVNEQWAVAPFVAFTVEAGSRGIGEGADAACPAGEVCAGWQRNTSYTSQLAALGASAHYHPFGGGGWLAPRLGLLVLRDIADASTNGAPPVRSSLYRLGSELGGGAGYDWHVSSRFALTFSGRVAGAWFPGASPAPLQGSTAASGLLVSVGVGGWFGVM